MELMWLEQLLLRLALVLDSLLLLLMRYLV
jgi:hypothetical protein